VLYAPAETGAVVAAAEIAAAKHGLSLTARSVEGVRNPVDSIGALASEVDVLWGLADSHVFTPQTTGPLILATLRRHLPLIGLSAAHVRAGALAALSCDYADVGRQTGELVARVLRGEAPGDVPVSAPRTVSLAINLRSAEHLGVAIPSDVRADAAEAMQ
jgi:putative ABC transport system substrate-binding protein